MNNELKMIWEAYTGENNKENYSEIVDYGFFAPFEIIISPRATVGVAKFARGKRISLKKNTRHII